VQLGNVATLMTKHPSGSKGGQVITGENAVPLQWDAANLKFPNLPEAEKHLTRTYRAGWAVEAA